MPQNKESWVPPVEFYFQVQFHFGTRHFGASFMEVGGIEQEITVQESGHAGGNGANVKLLKEIRNGNITLKRSLEPVSEEITAWVKRCFSYTMTDGRITPCTLVVFLMDAERHALACWAFSHAYPVKWSLGSLNAKESGLAIETLTLTYNLMERKK